ncbi:hypothetical protein CFR79_03575 [Komagataeibacter saccharivorans]|nr:hypothetical protein CFR79_03575 [Komagataeibacter saccharivorans]
MPDGVNHALGHPAVSDMPCGSSDLAWSITAGQHDAMFPFPQGGCAFIPLTDGPYDDNGKGFARNRFARNPTHDHRPARWTGRAAAQAAR